MVTEGIFEVPESVMKLGENAFRGCDTIKWIKIPQSVTKIGDCCFVGCEELQRVDMTEGLLSIGSSVCNNCPSITSIEIPSSVVRIGEGAFLACTNLTKLIFKNSKGWRKSGGGVFAKISSKVLSDPAKAAEALTKTTKYVTVGIERV